MNLDRLGTVRRLQYALPAIVAVFLLTGCQQKMAKQPAYRPLQESEIFPDGASARPLVVGSVPRGFLRDDEHLFRGKLGNDLVTSFPMAVTSRTLARGRERFSIFCAPCHSQLGDGNGMIVQRGFSRPPSYHEDRLLTAPVGHFYDVMTNGFGRMPSYAQMIQDVHDRWSIIAYVRALQLSQHASLDDVPETERVRVAAMPPPENSGTSITATTSPRTQYGTPSAQTGTAPAIPFSGAGGGR